MLDAFAMRLVFRYSCRLFCLEWRIQSAVLKEVFKRAMVGVVVAQLLNNAPLCQAALSTTQGIITTLNSAPVLKETISPLKAEVDKKFVQQFSIFELFEDPNGDPLALVVQQEDTNKLPGWLSFNTTTHQLSGIPREEADYSLKMIASDGKGGRAVQHFSLTVQDFGWLSSLTPLHIAGVVLSGVIVLLLFLKLIHAHFLKRTVAYSRAPVSNAEAISFTTKGGSMVV